MDAGCAAHAVYEEIRNHSLTDSNSFSLQFPLPLSGEGEGEGHFVWRDCLVRRSFLTR
jgi:hypothetical protein